jgi:predicted adenylyl cyclase CyaB
MIEVELKARVRDRSAVESSVAGFATRVGDVDKVDAYWSAPGWRADLAKRDFRVRQEGGASVVTFKNKRVEGGIEVNVEREFGVSDPEAFAALAERLGCERSFEKRKRGVLYEVASSCAASGKASIEIVEVVGLGVFVEIEELLESAEGGAVAAARSELMGFLARAGCAETDIEARFYSQLLAGAGLASKP